MKKYIHIQKADREFIAKTFKVSKRTVYNAIHFEDLDEGSEHAKKIRKLALERCDGGGSGMGGFARCGEFHEVLQWRCTAGVLKNRACVRCVQEG